MQREADISIPGLRQTEGVKVMKYKGFLLATAGGLAMVPGAQAADMPVKAPLMAPPPPVTWTGWYIGVNAGANWQNVNAFNAYDASGFNASDSGFIGGGQIGYNFQHGSAVFGLEGDISGLTGNASNIGGSNRNFGKGVTSKVDWLSTIRARVGLAVGDSMVYTTGGVAFGKVNNTSNVFGGSGLFNVKSESQTRVGWVIGGGVEHMWSPHFVIGLEGLFVDLGKSSVTVGPGPGCCGAGAKTTNFSNQLVIGRFRASYKF
jgi:outer membrane immunogenic protein